MAEESNSSAFSMGKSAQEKGLPYVPECYKIPASQRPSLSPMTAEDIPVVDLAGLKQGPIERATVIERMGNAYDALSMAFEFFKLPESEKMKYMSNDVHKPVRYCSSLKDGVDKIQYWRVFLKHYSHPLRHWIDAWPDNPSDYREKMGRYSTEVRKLGLELFEAITESLGLGPTYLSKKMEVGMQVMAVNCYPPCPSPDMALGLPPHSDYSCFTILLQSSHGLQIVDAQDGRWRSVPVLHGALQVHVGDHIEVLSNGLYKSVVHRAVLSGERTRISIASLHSLGLDEKMETAKQLVDEENPKRYKESSFKDFLNFLSANDLSEGKNFIDTLKIGN
ncbi:hypothetical protein FEM48_Zijuj03G0129400 [Ziziphus jujuba var. spinosa]|uniref:Fe2OG dioxygenase domain-containing protein n=1 Tax=Ziziphus jujuba var. spinosa TaxID=714518 RepID=A0A978VQF3_ZIZJJ|nr:hypothetical protein FEM48_Zijuj03G0129400 [Ziziphus jujuba var. spinosa]